MLILLFLAARPVRQSTRSITGGKRPVIILVDRSKSMSIREPEGTRYQRALDFMQRRLQPALAAAGLPVRGMAFDEAAEPVDLSTMASVPPAGKRTNLGGAIGQAIEGSRKPLAVIALTDGIANETQTDNRVMARLAESRIPFIGVGFGSDDGAQTLSLRNVAAPASISPSTTFNVSAELEMIRAQQTSGCDLLLFRDGQLLQKKAIQLGTGSRTWIESFPVSETTSGTHSYSIRVLAPELSKVNQLSTEGSTTVRVTDAEELRVLYVQGALTWDYKFISLAVLSDSVIKLTGLTRTSEQSVFRQNVENANELVQGFPASLEELGRYRVVVLASVRPNDLSLEQQELLAQFCAERGGGVLMLGGPATFDGSWQNSRLEKLLPVMFSPGTGTGPTGSATESGFRVQLSPAALQNPVFRLTETGAVQDAWAKLPAFREFGRVDSAKPGAQVWISHPTSVGPKGARILMASQQYGAGISTVLCLENLWSWRLAKESDPQTFDRFWRQLFRWIGNVGRQQVTIDVAAQDLRPGNDIQITVQRQPDANSMLSTNRQFLVQVEDSQKRVVQSDSIELAHAQPADVRFHPAHAGLYTLSVRDSQKSLVSSRSVEIRDTDVELEHTARSLETLTQWAAVSDGLAFKLEECPQAADLVAQIKRKVEQQVDRPQTTSQTVGLNAWTLSAILGCLTSEWLLRKKWALL